MKIVGGRRRGRQRRDQHGAPTSRSASGTTGWCAATSAFVRRAAGRRYAARSTSWSRCSCRSAASPGRRSGATAPGTVNRDGAAGRARRASTTRCAPASRSPSCSTTRSRSGSWPPAGSATRCASTATVPGQVDVLDGLVLPGPRRRRPRRRGRGRCSPARWDDFVVPGLGIRCVDTNPWVTGAETCELALALDALGDRTRARRGCSPTCSTCASDDGCYWTGYVYPRRGQLAGRAHDLHRRRRDARPRRPRRARPPGAGRLPRRPGWCPTPSRSRSSAAVVGLAQPTSLAGRA